MKSQKPFCATPKQALRTGIFWRLWILRLSGFVLFFFFITYNKSYAMLYISDDTFLAAAATIQSVLNGSSRLIFGFLFDKYGFKNTLFIQSISSAALTFLFVNLALFDNDEVGAKV